MKLTTKLLALAAAVQLTTMASAQSRALPFLAITPDAKSAAMGQTSLGISENMWIYGNPTSFFQHSHTASVDGSTTFFPKAEGASGRLSINTISGAYRIAPRHAVFAGFRYAGGLTFNGTDVSGNPTKEYAPFDWTLDAGYAVQLSPQWSAFASGSFIYSHLSHNARTFALSIGANYYRKFSVSDCPSRLSVTAKFADLGVDLDYGNHYKAPLPSSVALGGEFSSWLSPEHRVGILAQARYFFSPNDAKLFTAGIGAEYSYDDKITLRAGYEQAQHRLSHATFGAGLRLYGVRVNAAYAVATHSEGYNYPSVGIGLDF